MAETMAVDSLEEFATARIAKLRGALAMCEQSIAGLKDSLGVEEKRRAEITQELARLERAASAYKSAVVSGTEKRAHRMSAEAVDAKVRKALADFLHDNGAGWATPAHLIAEQAAVSESQARASLKRLEASGEVVKTARGYVPPPQCAQA